MHACTQRRCCRWLAAGALWGRRIKLDQQSKAKRLQNSICNVQLANLSDSLFASAPQFEFEEIFMVGCSTASYLTETSCGCLREQPCKQEPAPATLRLAALLGIMHECQTHCQLPVVRACAAQKPIRPPPLLLSDAGLASALFRVSSGSGDRVICESALPSITWSNRSPLRHSRSEQDGNHRVVSS